MKKLMLLTCIAIVFVATSFTLVQNSSTASVEGKITEHSTSFGLIGANIEFHQNGILKFGTLTDIDGMFKLDQIIPGAYDLQVSYVGFEPLNETIVIEANKKNVFNFELKESSELLETVVIKAYKAPLIEQDNTTQGMTVTAESIRSMPTKNVSAIAATSAGISKSENKNVSIKGSRGKATSYYVDGVRISKPHNPNQIYEEHEPQIDYSNESYEEIVENLFIDPIDEALSTFSIDVDRASYSNVRRFLDYGQMPPADAVRIEEMINYFHYEYEQPKGKDPLAMHSTLADCPWNEDHKILHIGLQGKKIETGDLPASNLVFLIDVSGSMNSTNKLPLVKASFKLLLNNLRDEDRVAIVTYAGSAGLHLESTPASEKQKILAAIERLGAGGSTAGAQGIITAYEVAKENFIKKGNNRVILATDGDFNVGISDNGGLEKLIEEKRNDGVFLSVLGFGIGNYKDHKMEILADKGNGNHAYIDNLQEARKVFINEFGGTLFTIAKDVKLQIEFNPGHVQAYRLIGYENRLLAKEDFNDDTKDAGELGAGHVVTAIYEIVPVGSKSSYAGNVDDLKYQKNEMRPSAKHSDELATIKFRYKKPDGKKSKKIINVVGPKSKRLKDSHENIRFSLAVAEFGMLLRGSSFTQDGSYKQVIELAEKAKGKDEEGYRAEFVRLVKTVQQLHEEIVQN